MISVLLGLVLIMALPLGIRFATVEDPAAYVPGQVITQGANADSCERESVRVAGGAWIGCQASVAARNTGRSSKTTRRVDTTGAVFLSVSN